MIKTLQKRFILFNMVVITSVLVIIEIAIFFNTNANISEHRMIAVLMICILLVFIASVIISFLAITPIKKAWQKQLDFTADASHELRTPLAVIQTNLELVLDNGEETVESQRKWLENIYFENIRMNKLVDDLLTLSRADSGLQEINKEPIKLDEIINSVVNKFLPLSQSSGIRLISECEHQLEMYGDYERMQQLFAILIDNAFKHMNCKGNIVINAYEAGNVITVEVADNGQGIETKELDRIFERFYRVDKVRSRKQGGSGLGLNIAKWIVEKHKGKITVQSKINEGTSFFITFIKK